MKKYLLLVFSIISIFFVSDRVEALSMTVNDTEVEVTDSNYIYYFYKEYQDKFDSYNYFLVYKVSSGQYRAYFYNTESLDIRDNIIYNLQSEDRLTCRFDTDYSFISCSPQTSSISWTIANISNVFLNSNLYDNSNVLLYSSNVSKQDLIDYFSFKYKINFYVDNQLYNSYEVVSNSSFDISQVEYTPPKNYKFNGWNLENIDLSNITSDINIYGTTSYVRPDMNYSENIDSIIHELSVSIIGKNVPVEFDYIYTIMDYLILLVLILCVISPFVILIKLLSGRW